MAEQQAEHLIELGRLPHVHVLVLPFSYGIHACMESSMSLLELPDGNQCAYVEPPGGGLLRTDAKTVATYRRRYDVLLSEAIPARASERLILSARESS